MRGIQQDADALLAYAQQNYGGPVVCFGHSIGMSGVSGVWVSCVRVMWRGCACSLMCVSTGVLQRVRGCVAWRPQKGGAIALDLAARHPRSVRALVVENTFRSMSALVADMYPAWTVYPYLARSRSPWLLWNRWDSERAIQQLHGPGEGGQGGGGQGGGVDGGGVVGDPTPTPAPILLLVGDRDEVVPREHSLRLAAIAKATAAASAAASHQPPDPHQADPQEPVAEVVVLPGMHDDTWRAPGYIEAIRGFLARVHLT